jgi:hypothetical protein
MIDLLTKNVLDLLEGGKNAKLTSLSLSLYIYI